MDEKIFILTRKDTGCSRSWTITDFDTEIIVPSENRTYQYIIAAKSSFEEQIIVTRILEEFFQQRVRNCKIQIVDIPLSKRMQIFLEFLAADNTVEIRNFGR